MKTIAINQFGSAEVFEEQELPVPKVSRSEVRVQIKAASFNPVDTKLRRGMGVGDFPLVLGVDFSGVIDAVGEEFGEFSVGDEVCGFAYGPCSNGTYAEYVTLPTQFVAKKPKNLSFAESAAIPCTYLTAFQALIGTGVLQKDRPFFIGGGSGGVGSAAIALAKSFGAGPVFTTSGSDKSTQYLIDRFHLPSENIISYEGLNFEELVESILARNGKRRFYLAFDCVGGSVKRLCNALCDFNGHLVSIVPEAEEFEFSIWGRDEKSLFQRSVSLHMLNMTTRAVHGDKDAWMAYKVQLRNLIKLFEEKQMPAPMTEAIGSFSKETVQKAHWRLEQGHTQGKLVMTI